MSIFVVLVTTIHTTDLVVASEGSEIGHNSQYWSSRSIHVTYLKNSTPCEMKFLKFQFISVREVAASTCLKKTTVHTILKAQLKFDLYKLQIVQELKGDYLSTDMYDKTTNE